MKKTRRMPENVGSRQEGRQALDKVSTLSDVAAYLQMTPAQVRELCRRRCVRPIPYLKAGRHLRFDLRSVAEWLQKK